MNRRQFLGAAAVSLASCAREPRGPHAAKPDDRPNIVLICTDQQHAWAYGEVDKSFQTIGINDLARWDGIALQAYCASPQCSPSRAALYTGCYPHRAGVIANLDVIDHEGEPIPPLPTDFETIGSHLRAAGYHTGYFGKWHLGNTGHFKSHFDVSDLDGDAHAGATDQAIDYLEARAGQAGPFALFVNYINPHDVYDFCEESDSILLSSKDMAPLPKSWGDRLDDCPLPQRRFMREDQGRCLHGKPEGDWLRYRAFYRQKCAAVDKEVVRIIETLNRLGLRDRTMTVFTSDHGDMDGHHGLMFKGPFMYEQVVRVPLIFNLPPRADKVRRIVRPAALVSLLDVLPTLCAAAGVSVHDRDGESLWAYLNGDSAPPKRDVIVGQYFGKQRWINPIRMLRDERYKYVRYVDHGEELYDLESDRDERVNRAVDSKYTGIKAEMSNRLDAWMATRGDTKFASYWSTNRDGSRWRPQAAEVNS